MAYTRDVVEFARPRFLWSDAIAYLFRLVFELLVVR
jgi:hypothetical protein